MKRLLQKIVAVVLLIGSINVLAQNSIDVNKVYPIDINQNDPSNDEKIRKFIINEIRKTDEVKQIDNHDFVHFFVDNYKKVKPHLIERFKDVKEIKYYEAVEFAHKELIPKLAEAYLIYREKNPKTKNNHNNQKTHFEAFDIINKGPGDPCTNADFETGDATGWDLSIGEVEDYSTVTAPYSYINVTPTTLAASSQHTIMTGAGTDPIGGFPVVFPGGGGSSLMLGDGTGTNYSAADASQTFLVDANSASFSYSYAIVLNDAGHTAEEQPYFKINMYDQAGNPIQCGDYAVVAGGSPIDPDFVAYADGVYMPWRTTFAPLQAYIGQNVTIEFVVGDCAQGGHYGYAYIDATCAPMDVLGPDTITCAGFPTISAPPGAASYLWSPTGETTQSIVATAPGHYEVTVTPVTGAACAITLDKDIYEFIDTVNAVFSANPTTICAGQSISFTDQSTVSGLGSIVSWEWDFDGNGTIDNTTQNPSHTYNTPGTYTVELTASSLGCDDVTTLQVIVEPTATANFTAPTVCVGSATSFTDASSAGVDTWGWDFDNNGSVDNTTQNPSHTFPAAGTYPVNLEVSIGGSCSHDTTINVTVNNSATANFTAPIVCAGTATSFTDASSAGVDAWNWDFDNNGTVDNTTQNPSHTFPSAGTYPVNLEVSVGGNCVHDTTINVTVGSSATANFTAPTVCAGLATTFTDASSAGVDAWNWDFDNNGTVDNTTQNPSHTFPAAGTYPVNLEVSVGGSCVHDTTINVIVSQGSTAIFSAPTACAGTPTSFTDASIGGVDTWNWDFDNNGSVDNTTENPSHTFPAAGTYPVNLEVSVAGACIHDTTINVVVNPNPTAGFTFTNVCFGTTTGFTNQSNGNGGTINQFAWDFTNDGVVDNINQNPTNGYSSAGTYTVELHVTTTDGCVDSITRVVTVNPIPVSDFSATTECLGNSTTFTDESTVSTGGISNWSWDFNDGSPADNTQSPTHTYSVDGTYNVTLTVTSDSGCINNFSTTVDVYANPVASFTTDVPCLASATTFTDSSTPGDNPISVWNWDFDNNTTVDNTLQNPTYILPSAGTHDVNLYVEDSHGCNHDTTITVTVSESPIANFTHTIECFGTSTTFTDSSNDNGGTTAIDTWEWDFDGNGTIDNSTQNPTFNFPAAGTYQTELFVTSALGCMDSITIAVVVDPIPVADFTATSECLEFTTIFTNNSSITTGTITQNDWDFADGTGTSTLLNPTYTYGSAGTFNVELTVTSDSGCTNSVIVPVTVNPKPTADFNVTDVCLNVAAPITDASVGNGGTVDQWEWDFTNNGSTDNTTQNPSNFYATDGTFDIRLIATTADGCKDTIIKPVTIHPMPTASFNYVNACFGTGIDFTNTSNVTSGTITNWDWSFGNGQSSTIENPTENYASEGLYNVQLIVTTNNNCKDTIIRNGIEVWPLPVVDFIPTTVCLNNVTQFEDQSTVSNTFTTNAIVNWTWDFADGSSFSNIQNPTHVYTAEGVYQASLIVTTNNNCVDTIVKDVTVYPLPVVDFTANITEGCTPVCATFTDGSTISSGNITQWAWDFNGDGISDNVNQNPANCFLNPSHSSVRDFDITLTATSQFGCSTTLTKSDYIHSYPIPLASFTYWPNDEASIVDKDIAFTDQSIIGSVWNWDLGDGTTTNVQNPEHEYQDTGFYLVTLAIENVYGCRDTTQKYVNIKPIYAIWIPNAFTPDGDFKNDFFFVDGYGIKELQVQIFDRWGLKLYDEIGVDQSWDGTYKGNLVQTDVYVYKIRAKDIFDEWHDYIGKVTLIK